MVKRVDTKVCSVCGKEKLLAKDFYISLSKTWGKLDGKLPVCKDCIIELYNNYLDEQRLGMQTTIIAICRKFDIYYSEEFYASVIEDSKTKSGIPIVSLYIAKCNLILSNRKEPLAFEDSQIGEIAEQNFKSGISNGVDLTKDERNQLQGFWGDTFKEGELLFLQDEFESYCKNYSNDMVKRKYFKMICVESLRLSQATTTKDRSDISKMISSLMKEANISPQITEKNKQEDDRQILGLKIADIEAIEPIDYLVNDKAAFVDAKGYKKYIVDYLYKPAKKLFGFE